MASLLRAGCPITIVNVCTRSDYAPYLESGRVDEDRAAQVTRARCAEDEAFGADLLRAAARNAMDDGSQQHLPLLEWVDLAWRDAPLRLGIATDAVLGEQAPREQDLTQLAQLFSNMPGAQMVLAPAALGGHIDHRMVRDAAVRTWGADRLAFYEDLPYACGMEDAQLRADLKLCLPWPCESVCAGGSLSHDAKRRFALHYSSQIAPELAGQMDAYSEALGGCERLYGDPAAMHILAEIWTQKASSPSAELAR